MKKTHSKPAGEDIFADQPAAPVVTPSPPAVITSTAPANDSHPAVVSKTSQAGDAGLGLLLIAMIVGAYLFPTVVAALRRHRNLLAVFITNVFFGWTFVGWIGALIWACTATQSRRGLQATG